MTTIYFSNEELEYLKKSDYHLAKLIKKYNITTLDLYDNIYSLVVFNIVSQMLSNVVANVLFKRLIKISPINPTYISKLSINDFVDIGISSRKASYILEFSSKIINEEFNIESLFIMDDKAAFDYLTSIKGIGEWTAEMILLFGLGRLNIWSFKDVALKNGILKAYPEFRTLSKRRFDKLGKLFAPYCSIASLYFYKANDDKDF